MPGTRLWGNPGGESILYIAHEDGTNPREIAKPATSVAWSHNGQWLAFTQFWSNRYSDIVIMQQNGTEKNIL
jgi:Tol biopolymer transport system component